MREFKVGDEVECALFGEGVVVDISSQSLSVFYPIEVRFRDASRAYTMDGKYQEDFLLRTLYHKDEFPPELRKIQQEQSRPNLNKDDKVLVSLDGFTWFKRYFASWSDEGINCYDWGNTEWSSDDRTTCWSKWKLPE